MPQREENLAKTTWILVRDGVEQGIFTLQQLHDLTFSGHLLPLDLLREAGSKELLPAWRVRGSNRGPGESKTPHTWVPKALPVMPSHLQRKMHWVNRWQSRRLQLGLACLGGFCRLAWPVFCHRLSDLVACGPDTCGLDGHRSSDSGVGINNLWRELCGAWVGQFGAHEGRPITII